ncbi:ABC transporter permease [Entomobacter blattae]|uniref:ABC transporter permease n=1 Tax=Entomobacter blattae TaxID=2762277 RepID=A0A7H1NQC4_9PROT|nr:hypothetical protein [Entomobacter blattae]QNT77984.1 hypothetical protein JGUZn3_07490 [Entomobacter blattae]
MPPSPHHSLSSRWHPLLSIQLALRDLWSDKVLTLCSILAIMAVIAPMIIVAGLRSGIIHSIRHALLENPHSLEIVSISNGSYTQEQLAQLAALQDVRFLIPKTRTLAASLLVEKPGHKGEGLYLTLQPTAKGDPLLAFTAAPHQAFPPPHASEQSSGQSFGQSFGQSSGQALDPSSGSSFSSDVMISSSAAAYLHVGQGDKITGYVNRIMNGQKENHPVTLTIQRVVPPEVTVQKTLYVTLLFALALEAYQDGQISWPNNLEHFTPPPQPVYAGFRLYAKKLSMVPTLDTMLRQKGYDILSHADEVQGLMSMSHNLSLLFLLVASIGGVGILVSLGAGLWANIERKRHILALLRFSGLSGMDLLIFPLTQSLILACLGALGGSAVAVGSALWINHIFPNLLPHNQNLCHIDTPLIAIACLLTLCGATCAAFLAGRRAVYVKPWEEGIITP